MTLGPIDFVMWLVWELNVTPWSVGLIIDSSGNRFDACCGFWLCHDPKGPFGSFGTARVSLSRDQIGLGFESL